MNDIHALFKQLHACTLHCEESSPWVGVLYLNLTRQEDQGEIYVASDPLQNGDFYDSFKIPYSPNIPCVSKHQGHLNHLPTDKDSVSHCLEAREKPFFTPFGCFLYHVHIISPYNHRRAKVDKIPYTTILMVVFLFYLRLIKIAHFKDLKKKSK